MIQDIERIKLFKFQSTIGKLKSVGMKHHNTQTDEVMTCSTKRSKQSHHDYIINNAAALCLYVIIKSSDGSASVQ